MKEYVGSSSAFEVEKCTTIELEEEEEGICSVCGDPQEKKIMGISTPQ